MTPPNRLILLAICTLLSLSSTTVLADETMATEADLARLSSQLRELSTKLQARVATEVDAVIEANLSRATAVAIARRPAPPPASRRTFAAARPSRAVTPLYTTSCTMLGRTFECVLRDHTVVR